jgi:hypothetical protein
MARARIPYCAEPGHPESRRMAHFPAQRPRVDLPDGVVTRWTGSASVLVEGTVHSFEAHAAALREAHATPGVRWVHDGLTLRIRLTA